MMLYSANWRLSISGRVYYLESVAAVVLGSYTAIEIPINTFSRKRVAMSRDALWRCNVNYSTSDHINTTFGNSSGKRE